MKPTPRSVLLRTVCALLVAGSFLGLSAAPALAQDIISGEDILQTEPGTSGFDFGPAPLPADYFGPGSDPFDGIIAFNGDPLGSSPHCPNDDLSLVSTIVTRHANAALPAVPSSDTVPIEIVALSLVSTSPITVTYNGGQNPEAWDVRVELSVAAQQQGSLTVTRTTPVGGTFDMSLPVLPLFIFTRVSDSQVVELDFGLAMLPPVVLEGSGIPWEDKPLLPGSCTTNWCPSPGMPFVLAAPNATHGVRAECPVAIPTLSTWMALALAMLLVVVGTLWLRRRAQHAPAA